MKIEKLREIMEPELLQLEGVVGVSHENPRDRLIVYVEDERYLDAVPTILAGKRVEKRVIGKIKLLSHIPFTSYRLLTASPTDRIRPAPAGVSIGHIKITAGTFGAVVWDKDGSPLILSNNHIIALVWGNNRTGKVGDPIIQPGPYDGGTEADTIAHLLRYVPVELEKPNTVDCAVARPLEGMVTTDILGVGKYLGGWTDAYNGMSVEKVGRTTFHTSSYVMDTHATIKVEGWGSAIFTDQILIDSPNASFIAGGDSGSLLFTRVAGVPIAVGLCFAGSDRVGVANKIRNVIEALNIDMGPYIKTEARVSFMEFIPILIPITLIGGIMLRKR
ncbi:MAG: hypothetical protein ACTSR0_04235 [Candidatus Asgardarchaeia archaeon]